MITFCRVDRLSSVVPCMMLLFPWCTPLDIVRGIYSTSITTAELTAIEMYEKCRFPTETNSLESMYNNFVFGF